MNAGKKAATPIHELLGPYSLYRRQAEVKAVAVCPEGKDRKSEPSGLSTPANDLKEQIVIHISANEKTVDINIGFHWLRLFIPANFIPNMITTGI